MPWNSQGGGPWGNGPGPWGGRPGGGGQQPPDLEELLRRSQERVKNLLPGMGGPIGGRRGIVLLAVAAVAIWLASRLLPRPAGGGGRRAALRRVRPHDQSRPQLPPAVAGRGGDQAPGRPREPDRGRLPLRLGPARHAGHARARRLRRGADPDRRREHHRHQLCRPVEDQRRQEVPVRHPRSRGHREGRLGERDARDHRPDPDRRGDDRGPAARSRPRRASSSSSS